MRNFIKALPLAILLPIVLAMASVPPNAAISNLAQWVQFIGIHNVPTWLTSRAIDPLLIVLALVLACLYALAAWGSPWRKSNLHARQLGDHDQQFDAHAQRLERLELTISTASLPNGGSIGAARNTQPNALKIAFSPTPEFLPETTFRDSPARRRSVAVELRNEGNGWLSECTIEVTSIAPPPPPDLNYIHPLAVLDVPCLLHYDMTKKLIVVAYNRIESTSPHPAFNAGPTLFFSAPWTYGSGAHTILSPTETYAIRLKASSADSGPHEIDLWVWVDSHRVIQAKLVHPGP